MCSLLVHNKNFCVDMAHKLHQKRGPDGFATLNIGDVIINHYLLSMGRGIHLQPFYKDKIVCAFNGEIYNPEINKAKINETEFLLDLFQEYGTDFTSKIDGEYLIFVYEIEKNLLHFFTDKFGTKPLYYFHDSHNFIFSSIRKVIDDVKNAKPQKLKANSHLTFNLITFCKKINCKPHNFDLSQNVDTYEPWNQAFLSAVSKRFASCKWDILLPLSSGHDSGALACALNLQNISFHTMSFIGEENLNILLKRLKIQKIKNKRNNFVNLLSKNFSAQEFDFAQNMLAENCDYFTYGGKADIRSHTINGHQDPGAIGKSFILSHFRNNLPETRIMASGHGPDELMSNIQTYTFGKPNPIEFSQRLDEAFPWENVFEGTNSSYLACDEAICGGYSFEGRYPFLDTAVVQAFLNLTPKMKNRTFKAPLVNFLKMYDYPVWPGCGKSVKRGFNTRSL